MRDDEPGPSVDEDIEAAWNNRDGKHGERRNRDAMNDPQNPPEQPAKQQRHVKLPRGSEMTVKTTNWAWPGWLAKGKLHILAGDPGVGKTTLAIGLAAVVTSGGRWPDRTRAIAGNTIVWSGEDDPEDTLLPRLIAAGGDPYRIRFVGQVCDGNTQRAFDPSTDVGLLTQQISELDGGVDLVLIDPIVMAVAGDGHKNNEVRRSLQPLADMAASLRCVMIGISHLSKGTAGRNPVDRITGSLAFGAAARVVMMAAKHQEADSNGRHARILCRAKSNIGPDGDGFAFDLHQEELERHPGVFASFVRWGNPVEGTARELLAQADAVSTDDDGARMTPAQQLLCQMLDGKPMSSKEIERRANDAGFSMAAMHRAKKGLDIRVVKSSMDGGWWWSLGADRPAEDCEDCEDCEDDGLNGAGDRPSSSAKSSRDGHQEGGNEPREASADAYRQASDGG